MQAAGKEGLPKHGNSRGVQAEKVKPEPEPACRNWFPMNFAGKCCVLVHEKGGTATVILSVAGAWATGADAGYVWVLENFHLKVFRAVAEHLSFRKAGEAPFVTQPAVNFTDQDS
jgi:hypothetical protein